MAKIDLEKCPLRNKCNALKQTGASKAVHRINPIRVYCIGGFIPIWCPLYKKAESEDKK